MRKGSKEKSEQELLTAKLAKDSRKPQRKTGVRAFNHEGRKENPGLRRE
jgi:hypothetical protein